MGLFLVFNGNKVNKIGCFIKKFLNSVWREFVFGGHLLSLGASSIVFTSAILLNIPITWDFLLVVYLITYTVYLYNRFEEFEGDFLTNPDRTQHIKGYIKYTPLIIFCSTLIIIGMLLRFGNFLSLIFGLVLLLLGVLYSVCLKKVTRKIVGFKSFYVSFTWALLVVFTGIYYSIFNSILLLFFIFTFLILFVNVSFCDIKDIKSDNKKKLLSLVIILGKEKLLKILSLITVLAMLPIVIGFYLDVLPKSSLMLLLIIPYSLYFFEKSRGVKVNLIQLTYIFIHGEYILWSLLILLGKILL